MSVRAAIIMAGGAGERFWPLSRRDRPKQLLRLTGSETTLLEEAVERLEPLVSPEHTYIVTGEHLLQPIRASQCGIPDENVVAEPCKRNTSGCLAYAAAFVLSRYGVLPEQITMLVTTADHLIENGAGFGETCSGVLHVVENYPVLATIGIVPDRPETGYGYIQVSEEAPLDSGNASVDIRPVAAFHEKPSSELAAEYLASGQYLWNSGMFAWRIDTFLNELDIARPALAKTVRDMAKLLSEGKHEQVRSLFAKLDDISIDYALMEHSQHVVVARAGFEWDDIGAWPALDRTRPHDADGNVVVGESAMADCRNCIVYNEAEGKPRTVGLIGLEDMVVVATEDALLVMPKERAQDVREIVKWLKAQDNEKK